MTVEYLCEGCGVLVVAISLSRVPPHGFCGSCVWLCEFVDEPAVFDKLFHRFCAHARVDRKRRRKGRLITR